MNWKSVDTVIEGQPIDINGLNPWEHKWRPIEVPFGQRPFFAHVFEIGPESDPVRFAAGEQRTNVWVFFLPD